MASMGAQSAQSEQASTAHPWGFSAVRDEGEEVLTVGNKTSSFHTSMGVVSGHHCAEVDLRGVLHTLLYSTSICTQSYQPILNISNLNVYIFCPHFKIGRS